MSCNQMNLKYFSNIYNWLNNNNKTFQLLTHNLNACPAQMPQLGKRLQKWRSSATNAILIF